jgi:hypothetical protein
MSILFTEAQLYRPRLPKKNSMTKVYLLLALVSFGSAWAEESLKISDFKEEDQAVLKNWSRQPPRETLEQARAANAARAKALELPVPKVVQKQKVSPEPEVLKGDFDLVLQSRECKDCTGHVSQGYITKIVHPVEGAWEINPGEPVHFSAMESDRYRIESYKVTPDKAEVGAVFKQLNEGPTPEDLAWAKTLKPQDPQPFNLFEALDNLFTEFCNRLENIPAGKLFFLTATVVLAVFSIPAYQKFKKKP